MAGTINITHGQWYAGEARTIVIDVVDADDLPQAMTGWALLFVVRHGKAGDVLFSKDTDDGIVIGDGAATDDRATVTAVPADTLDEPGIYDAALWRTDGENDVVLSEGVIIISEAAAQLPVVP